MLIEIVLAALTGVYFWDARTSIAERDRVRTAETQEVQTSHDSSFGNGGANTYDDNRGIMANDGENTNRGAAISNPGPGGPTIAGGVLNDKAIELPQPAYPAAARAVRAKGTVTVQVTVDEAGGVVSANALTGHPLLRSAAVQAARRARFEPTIVGGVRVPVKGVVTYDFSAQ